MSKANLNKRVCVCVSEHLNELSALIEASWETYTVCLSAEMCGHVSLYNQLITGIKIFVCTITFPNKIKFTFNQACLLMFLLIFHVCLVEFTE